ncbi:hypothetical protein TOPH_02856 [Tolypocladium ophioglossoides CBS 100239]|uniref:Uncharacterized protein n=1 Tax=Tolypocladium ophioglossoides (strain CBS 100239) TaxID=1163406 RepID=A0A0L0NF20_TOLOC|nr:hypothetical protein TOPH_02856 [Tolypocladium ophioglossoides CBS 100239]
MPPAAGLRAHVELSRISGHVVGNARQPDRAVWMLEQWQAALPPAVRLGPDGLAADPACCLLHMRYNQLLIVAIRPLFYAAVRRAVAARLMAQPAAPAPAPAPDPDPDPQLGHLRCCLAAAARNMRLARRVIALNGHRKLLHAGLHFIFNAAVCLILRRLVVRDEDAAGALRAAAADVDFAIAQMREAAAKGNADGGRSEQTLRDLRALVARLTAPPADPVVLAGGAAPGPSVAPLLPEHDTLPPMAIGEDPMLYDELVTWMGDDWPIYNGYMAEAEAE